MKKFTAAKLWGANLLGLFAAYPIAWIIPAAIIVVVLAVVLFKGCGGESEPTLNKDVINRQNEIQRESNARIDAAKENVLIQKQQSDARINEAAENTEKARNKNYSNKNNRDLADELERRKPR